MGQYTDIFTEAAEIARQERHPGSQMSIWGKDPNPPRGPKKLLDVLTSWYALFSSHELKNEVGTSTRSRTLDFFVAEREGLTEELANNGSSIVLDGKRYQYAAEPRHEVGEPRYYRFICSPTGESV